jgi:hypothetical protein
MVWLIDIVVYIINQKVKDSVRNYCVLLGIVKLLNEVRRKSGKVGKPIIINVEVFVRRHYRQVGKN